ncbi:MAG: hypothetical protein V4850_01720 [Myxococcota bacterium]
MSALLPLLALVACTPKDAAEAPTGSADGYVLGSVVITPDGRTTYFQVLPDLDPDGPVTNTNAVEAAGNGVLLTHGHDIFLGLAESPEWVRYTVGEDGTLAESGRMSLAGKGFSYVDYGNAILADDLAVSISTEAAVAVTWNPSTMEILDTIELPHLVREGYGVEVWTTIAEDGLVYIPARWADWEGGRIYPLVSTTILDPRTGTIVGIAEDDRCASGGRIVFDEDGYGYVMGDGRNYAAQMFANAGGETAAPNCILRIAPGETDYEADYHVEIPALTGGYESATELEFASQGSGVAFTWLFYPEELPAGVEPIDFGFWSYPVFKLWKITLGDVPEAEEVDGVPFSVLGFDGASLDDHLYVGLGDNEVSVIYEVDPDAGTATERFTMDGYFYGLFALE